MVRLNMSTTMDQRRQYAYDYSMYPMVFPQSYASPQEHLAFNNMGMNGGTYAPITTAAPYSCYTPYNYNYQSLVTPFQLPHLMSYNTPYFQATSYPMAAAAPYCSPLQTSGFENYNTAQHNHQFMPSPVQSVATTSTLVSTSSQTSKKMPRKSPVIVASTSLESVTSEETTFERENEEMTSEDMQPTNVYIKGLPVTMTDEALRQTVEAFGKVISSKAIIERPSGVCKGYGFAKFKTLEEAEACIQYLNDKKYEAGIARDSFYSKLKDLADLESTNLYVSNLPITWNEERIMNIFAAYEPSKCRLLINAKGQSRGVAFVTFASRAICDRIIEEFNGIDLHERYHPLSLQVRYADTLAQKKLKKEKAVAGQFPKRSVLATHMAQMQQLHHSDRNTQPQNQTAVAVPQPQPQFVAYQPGHQRQMSTAGREPLHFGNKVWKKNDSIASTVSHVNVNAPPTPPQSVVSSEDEVIVKVESPETAGTVSFD